MISEKETFNKLQLFLKEEEEFLKENSITIKTYGELFDYLFLPLDNNNSPGKLKNSDEIDKYIFLITNIEDSTLINPNYSLFKQSKYFYTKYDSIESNYNYTQI